MGLAAVADASPLLFQVIHGEIGENPLETLAVVASDVFMPMLTAPANQQGWPDVVAKEVTENLHKFVNNGEQGPPGGRSSRVGMGGAGVPAPSEGASRPLDCQPPQQKHTSSTCSLCTHMLFAPPHTCNPPNVPP